MRAQVWLLSCFGECSGITAGWEGKVHAGLKDFPIDLNTGAQFTARMQVLWAVAVSLLIGLCGCTHPKPVGQGGSAASADAQNQRLIITPETALSGKVLKVNREARFVVLNFPVGRLPAVDQRLNVYRRNLKVGEVKVTGPQREDNIVADITVGEAEAGDEVRDR
jgi:hypothetical protein